MDSESLKIIEELFGEEGKMPIKDPKTYEAMPLSFWTAVKRDLDIYKLKTNIPDLFFELKELVKKAGNLSEEDIIIMLLHPNPYTITSFLGKINVFSLRNPLYFAENIILTMMSGKLFDRDPDVTALRSESLLSISRSIEEKRYNEKFFKFIKRFFVVISRYAEHFTELFNWCIAVLKDYLYLKNYKTLVKTTEKKIRKRFADYRRNMLQKQYQEYDSKISEEFFEKDPVNIEYPELMIDRISIGVYSEEFMCYREDVTNQLSMSSMDKDIQTEQLMYTKMNLVQSGYTDEEIEVLFPIGLDKEFSFMENRSVLSGFKLKDKPKRIKDGAGFSYLWRTEGITYRFIYNHPSGYGPIRLDMYANMQRLVYNRIAENCAEIVEAYNEELIEETNFIPIGYEK